MEGTDPEALAAREFLYDLGLAEKTLRGLLIGLRVAQNDMLVVFPDLCARGSGSGMWTGTDLNFGDVSLRFDTTKKDWVRNDDGRISTESMWSRIRLPHGGGGPLYPLAQARDSQGAIFICDNPVEALLSRQGGLNAVASVGGRGGRRGRMSIYDLAEVQSRFTKPIVIVRRRDENGNVEMVGMDNFITSDCGWCVADLPVGSSLPTCVSGVETLEELCQQHDVALHPGHDIRQLALQLGTFEEARDALMTPAPVADLLTARWSQSTQSDGPPAFYTGADLATALNDEPEFIAEFVPVGSLVDVIGLPKVGKSTLIADLTHAVIKGKPFLGRLTKQGPVVYLTEQGKASFRETIKRVGLVGCADLHLMFYGDHAGKTWPEIAALALAKAKEVGAELIVVDTLPQFAGMEGDAENSAGAALEAVRPLQAINAQGIAVVVNRHERKGGGSLTNSGRGSGAFAGAMDVIVRIRKPEGNVDPNLRVLDAVGRFDVPSELYISFDDRSGTFHSRGDNAAFARNRLEDQITDVLIDAGGAIGSDRIKTLLTDQYAVRIGRERLDRTLAEMTAGGKLIREGKGVKGDPFTYRAR